MNDEASEPAAPSMRSVRFQIIHLLYATALISSALATFGAGGTVLAAIVCAAWAWVFVSETRPRAFWNAAVIISISGCLCGLLAPGTGAREAARRMQCANNLKQIALALHNYHDRYKSFPPAYFVDEQGRPTHSWRVLILPYVEEQPLYEAYSFDESWDGPNNSKLLKQMPSVYRCPSQVIDPRKHTHTNYAVIVGANTVWPGNHATHFRDITDGTSNTLLVCEVTDRKIPWMEPTDLGYSDAIERLTSTNPHQPTGHIYQTFFHEWWNGRQIAIADGTISFLEQGATRADAIKMLDKSDGKPIDIHELRGSPISKRRLRIDNCIRLGVFILVVLWPVPWVWINPNGTRPNPSQIDASQPPDDGNDQVQ